MTGEGCNPSAAKRSYTCHIYTVVDYIDSTKDQLESGLIRSDNSLLTLYRFTITECEVPYANVLYRMHFTTLPKQAAQLQDAK